MENTHFYIFPKNLVWMETVLSTPLGREYCRHCEWTKKGTAETCLHNAEEVSEFATQLKPGHWCFLGPASESTWWNGTSNEPQEKYDMVVLRVVDMFDCPTFPPDIPSDRAITPWIVEERRETYPVPSYIRQQEDSHQNLVGKQFPLFSQSCLPR